MTEVTNYATATNVTERAINGTTVGRQRSNAKAVDAQCNPANRQRNIRH